MKNITPLKADIKSDLTKSLFPIMIDKVFRRWVLMFVSEVEKIVGDVYNLLEIGGKFISIEYFKFAQIDLFPHGIHFERIYRNVEKLLINNGGNPNIGKEIYKIMHLKGFKNIELYPIYRTGKVNSTL
jgi:hypothetical protein